MSNKEKKFYVYLRKQKIEVTEEVYRVIKRDEWREEQRKYRSWRCRDGKGIRCKSRCEECPYYRIGNGPRGSDVSIEGLMDEENGIFDIPDLTTDVEVEVARNILRSDLHKARISLNDRERELFDMLLEERSERDIASKFGISNSRAHTLKVALLKKLQGLLIAYKGYFG